MIDMTEITRTRLTAADYFARPETNRIEELIDGEIIVAAGATIKHQLVNGNLYVLVRSLMPGGKPFHPPTAILFDDENVVEPDVIWLSDENIGKLKEQYIDGAPDLLIEVFSPSTAKRDKEYKFTLYEKYGVREYWMVDPVNRYVEVYVLQEGVFMRQGVYGEGDTFTSPVLGDKAVEVRQVFA